MVQDKNNPLTKKYQIRVGDKFLQELKFLADWYDMPAAEIMREYVYKDYNRVQILIKKRNDFNAT